MARGRIKVEQHHKRIRAFLGGQVVIDHAHPLLVWEKPFYPTYHFPREAFAPGVLRETEDRLHSPSRGDAVVFDVVVPSRVVPGGAYGYQESPMPELVGMVALAWREMDHWFEEDEEVYVHARDPYTRVEVLQSSRHVRVEIDGVTVAESNSPRILHESGLPPRYYLPKTAVRLDLLTPTSTVTACPYKGTARYWSATIGDSVHADMAWGYDTPLPESAAIAGYVCFFDERVDVHVDGELQERPGSRF